MALYRRINGTWTLAKRPYVKRNGVWTGAKTAWVKRSGVWTQAYEYDITPPDPPVITLQIYEDFDTIGGIKTLKSRWIRIGVRLPAVENDPDAALVRVLTDYNGAAPTTQFGGTFTSAADDNYPNEPWSEWRYNQPYNPWDFFAPRHTDSSVENFKTWPRSAKAGTLIKGDQWYHFTGWSLDVHGNWSVGTEASIHVPKNSVDAPNVVVKEARFQANSSGSWRDSTGYVGGYLEQAKSPRSVGLFFYGSQIVDTVGQQTSPDEKVNVRSSQILLSRRLDNGPATVNLYLFWTPYSTVASLPSVGTALTKNECAFIGTIAKGQTKWFDLPAAFNNNFNTGIKGVGLDWKDPAKADATAADYSVIDSVVNNLRCGEIHVTWEETL